MGYLFMSRVSVCVDVGEGIGERMSTSVYVEAASL